MPRKPRISSDRTPTPIAASRQPLDLPTLKRTADRLRAAFGALIDRFPSHARSMGGMAIWLKVSKSTTQRLVEGLSATRSDVEALQRMPGSLALRAVVEAAERELGPSEVTASAAQAVDQYDVLIASVARSRRAFVDVLAAGVDESTPVAPTRADRRALYSAALKVTGESLRAKSAVSIIRPSPTQAGKLREVVVVSYLQARRRSFARPLVASLLGGYWTREELSQLRDTSGVNVPQAHIVERFTTAHARAQVLSGRSAHTVLLLDFPEERDRENWLGPVDASVRFMHDGATSPLTDPSTRFCSAVRIHQPTEVLAHDIIVHRSLAERCDCSTALVSFGAKPGDLPSGEQYEWFEKLPEDTKVTRMGSPARALATDLVPMQQAIMEEAMRLEAINPSEFVAYRAVVEYPQWQCEYRVNFALRDESVDA